MATKKNIFISHINEDDKLLSDMRDLFFRREMNVKDDSIDIGELDDENKKEDIVNDRITPMIEWADVLVVLITKGAKESLWVDWNVECAVKKGIKIVGIFAKETTSKNIPSGFNEVADAAKVGWQREEKIIDAIESEGKSEDFDDPVTGEESKPQNKRKQFGCQ